MADDLPRALAHDPLSGVMDIVGSVGLTIDEPGTEPDIEAIAAALPRETDTILVAGPIGASAMRHLADLALVRRCEVLALLPTEAIEGHPPVIITAGSANLVRVAPRPDRSAHHRIKRALDILGAVFGITVAAPLMALCALAIKLESRGPVFYRQKRLGRRGGHFDCIKLRTMRHDADELLARDPALYAAYRTNHFKIPDDADARITRVGRVLRRTSVDELPQLWNVLRGEMSLVGPRPVVAEEITVYGVRRELLLSMRPGITGSWAVNGRHGVGYPERCELELRYVRGWSLLGDFGILSRTLAAVIAPGG